MKVKGGSMVGLCFDPSVQRQQQANLGELQVILLYLRSSRATRLEPSLKKKERKTKETKKRKFYLYRKEIFIKIFPLAKE